MKIIISCKLQGIFLCTPHFTGRNCKNYIHVVSQQKVEYSKCTYYHLFSCYLFWHSLFICQYNIRSLSFFVAFLFSRPPKSQNQGHTVPSASLPTSVCHTDIGPPVDQNRARWGSCRGGAAPSTPSSNVKMKLGVSRR